MSDKESEFNCRTCEKTDCDFNPANPEVYFIDQDDGTQKVYPGIEIVYEFTLVKGCAVHSSFIAPLDVLEKEIKGGQTKYQEMINTSEDKIVYTLALKALTVCLQRIQRLRDPQTDLMKTELTNNTQKEYKP